MTTGCLNGKHHGGSSSAAVWRDGSSIIRESFSSTPSPWKQQEDFWTHLIDSFIGWFHWDTIHLDLQLVSKEEVARRGSSVISSIIANQRQLTPGHSQCWRERVFGSVAPTDFWSCWTPTTLFFMKKNPTSLGNGVVFDGKGHTGGLEGTLQSFNSWHCRAGLKHGPSKSAVRLASNGHL